MFQLNLLKEFFDFGNIIEQFIYAIAESGGTTGTYANWPEFYRNVCSLQNIILYIENCIDFSRKYFLYFQLNDTTRRLFNRFETRRAAQAFVTKYSLKATKPATDQTKCRNKLSEHSAANAPTIYVYGEYSKRRGGIGIWHGVGNALNHSVRLIGKQTSDRALLQAVCIAIRQVRGRSYDEDLLSSRL